MNKCFMNIFLHTLHNGTYRIILLCAFFNSLKAKAGGNITSKGTHNKTPPLETGQLLFSPLTK